jgi:hypothetical protein
VALVPRELTITWGAYSISTAAGQLINGYTYNDDGYDTANVEFEFVVTGVDDTAFASACAAAEAAFRKPRQTFTITQNATPLISLSHANNTGFDCYPTIIKQGQVGDTARSRFYRVRITFGRPADNVGTSGRRTGTIDVSYLPSRQRVVTISGTYTAMPGGLDARAQYLAQIDAYCSSVLTTVGVTTYDFLEEPVTESNDTDKIINFTRVYKELIYPQAGQTNDLAIIGDSLEISAARDGTEDGPGSYHLATVSVSYSCWIDKNVTTDLKNKWTSIRSSILDKVRSAYELGTVGIISDAPEFSYTDNRIMATMILVGITQGNLLSYRQTTKKTNEIGQNFVPAWTGDPLSYYVFQGPQRMLTTKTTKERRTTAAQGSEANIGGGAGGGFSPGLFVGTGGGGGSVFAGGLFGTGTSWIGGSILGPGDPESTTGLFGQSQLPQSLGNEVGAGGADPGGVGGGAGGGARDFVYSYPGAPAAPTPARPMDPGTEADIVIFTESEETPGVIGLADDIQIPIVDKLTITITQHIKKLSGKGFVISEPPRGMVGGLVRTWGGQLWQ